MKDKEQIEYLGELEFLDHSNRIEREYSNEALEDAIIAWEYIKDLDIQCQFTINTILHVHYLLMKRLRPAIAGKVRNCDLWIGGKKRKFVSKIVLYDLLKRWEIESIT